MGHSYKGGSVPPGNHTPTPPPALVLSTDGAGGFTLMGAPDVVFYYLFWDFNAGGAYTTVDQDNGPSPIIYTEEPNPGRFFCDIDGALTAPGPNSSNVVVVP